MALANLSWRTFIPLIDELVSKGWVRKELLECRRSDEVRSRYYLTDKGMKILKLYEDLIHAEQDF